MPSVAVQLFDWYELTLQLRTPLTAGTHADKIGAAFELPKLSSAEFKALVVVSNCASAKLGVVHFGNVVLPYIISDGSKFSFAEFGRVVPPVSNIFVVELELNHPLTWSKVG